MTTLIKTHPDLYLKKGRELIQIPLEKCGPLMEIFKDGRGFSEMHVCHIRLYDMRGIPLGYISYNGRVWLGDPRNLTGNTEIPQTGCPTVAQRDTEGWQ